MTVKHLKYVAIALVLLASQFSIQPTFAQADVASAFDELNALWLSGDTDGAQALYSSFPPDIQQALEAMMMLVSVEEEVGPLVETESIAAASCWYRTHTFSANNSFGVKVYEIGQTLEWCGSGGAITQANCSAWGTPTAWPFNFKGWVTYCGTSSGGIGWNLVRKFSQASFEACPAVIPPCAYHSPQVYQQAEPSGAYAGWGSL